MAPPRPAPVRSRWPAHVPDPLCLQFGGQHGAAPAIINEEPDGPGLRSKSLFGSRPLPIKGKTLAYFSCAPLSGSSRGLYGPGDHRRPNSRKLRPPPME